MIRFVLALLCLTGAASAFVQNSLPASRVSKTLAFEYIPAGFTKDSWKAFKAKEKSQQQTKNLGGVGPRGFKSRSFQSFQEALERGETTHLLPVFNAKEKLAKGLIKEEDVPYMQRGGNWDNSDVKGAKKAKWLSSDKEYSQGGFKKTQSVSIFGGDALDWTGQRQRAGPESAMGAPSKFKKNYKPPNVNTMKGVDTSEPKKKLFGLF
ncbi:hypothetical protein MPSEU_000100900 [Mayamaea pseudoterrestris]|nr:hypothetical protein MPSEU_000100900 [Mayamaea pseudoterrestris]